MNNRNNKNKTMKTLKEIRAAAVKAAADSTSAGESNMELNKACIEGFTAAGGSDPEDYDIFERYWRAERQRLKGEQAHIEQLGEKLSPSGHKEKKKAEAAAAATKAAETPAK